MPFGAFVEVLPGKEGLVHLSKMSTEYVNKPEDILSVGDKVKVRVVEIDQQKRINLSMLFGADANKPDHRRDRGGSDRDQRYGSRPQRRGFSKDNRGPRQQYKHPHLSEEQ